MEAFLQVVLLTYLKILVFANKLILYKTVLEI